MTEQEEGSEQSEQAEQQVGGAVQQAPPQQASEQRGQQASEEPEQTPGTPGLQASEEPGQASEEPEQNAPGVAGEVAALARRVEVLERRLAALEGAPLEGQQGQRAQGSPQTHGDPALPATSTQQPGQYQQDPPNWPAQGQPQHWQPPNYPAPGYQPQHWPAQGYQPQHWPAQGYQPQHWPAQGYQPQHWPAQGYQPQHWPAPRHPRQGGGPQSPASPALPQLSSTVLVAAAGALIFLLGAGWFLYWSIERGYLTPAMRVALGVLAGIGLGIGAVRLMLKKSSLGLGITLYLAGLGTLIFSLYYGAMIAELLPPLAGFAAVGATVVLSAWLAVRLDNQGILAVAYGLGLAAPLIFNTGNKQYLLLSGYLIVLQIGATVVLYLAKRGGDWHAPRIIGLGGMWLLLLIACGDARDHQLLALLGLVIAAFVSSTVWTTLPRHQDRPQLVAFLWAALNVAVSSALAVLWVVKLEWAGRRFAWVLVALAIVNLVALPLFRRRLGDRSADPAPVAIAALCALSAAPVGLEFDTASIVWCLLAALLAGTALVAQRREHAEALLLMVVAFPVALVASFGWLWMVADRPTDASAIANVPFADGAIVTATWALLTRMHGPARAIAFVGAELVFHLTLGIETFYVLEDEGGRLPLIGSTVFCALSAGAHFVASFRLAKPESQALAIASYVLFGVAALKLLLFDLDGAGTVVRAVAALGIGVIFIVSALVANKLRSTTVNGSG